jgi:hypothetical protein
MPVEKEPITPLEAEVGELYVLNDGRTIRFDETNPGHASETKLWVPHWNICSSGKAG